MTDEELLTKLAKVKHVTVFDGQFGTIVQFWYPHPHNAHSFMRRGDDSQWYHENGWSRQAHADLKAVVQWVKQNDPTKQKEQ